LSPPTFTTRLKEPAAVAEPEPVPVFSPISAALLAIPAVMALVYDPAASEVLRKFNGSPVPVTAAA
jgi:hypothetical protein